MSTVLILKHGGLEEHPDTLCPLPHSMHFPHPTIHSPLPTAQPVGLLIHQNSTGGVHLGGDLALSFQ